MPRLNALELSKLVSVLEAGGCAVERTHGYRIPATGFKLEQVPAFGVNTILEKERGGIDIVMELTLTNELDHPMRVREVQITAPWRPMGICLLPEPVPPREYYSLANETLTFPVDLVINKILLGRETIRGGGNASGLLLAKSDQNLPDHVGPNARVTFNVAVFDRSGHKFESEFRLCVQRIERKPREHPRGRTFLVRDTAAGSNVAIGQRGRLAAKDAQRILSQRKDREWRVNYGC